MLYQSKIRVNLAKFNTTALEDIKRTAYLHGVVNIVHEKSTFL